jgi:NAD(P)H-hydrate epimerase
MPMAPITVAQMREVDRLMIEEYSIALLQMMENAGRSLAALARMVHGGDVANARVVVLVGTGNNGGGGLVAARHLANAGADVRVALTASPPLPGEVPEHQRMALANMGIPGAGGVTEAGAIPALVRDAELILDALIGYSLRGAPREPVATWIRLANAAPGRRVALDLPSGLDGDGGVPRDPTLRAAATLTLAWPKAGLVTPAAPEFVGDLYLADISVPEAVYRAVGVHRGDLFARGPVVRVRPVIGGWEPDEALTAAW